MFIIAIPFAFGFLHLLLFLFYPKAVENLYYSITVFILAGGMFVNSYPALKPLVPYFLIVMNLFLLRFVYALVYTRLPRWFFFFVAFGVGMGIWVLLDPQISSSFIFNVFSLVFILEIIRVVISSIKKRVPGMWIIGLGLLFASAEIFYEILRDVFHFPSLLGIRDTTAFAVLAILVSMSVYLSWRFARMNTALEKKKEELEILNRELEERVAQRTKELAEANKSLEEFSLNLSESRNEIQVAHIKLLKAHEELRQAQTQLVQSEKMASLGTLAAGIAHEINTPVGAVNSAADTTQRSVRKVIETIQDIQDLEELKKGDKIQKALGTLQENIDIVLLGSERITKIVRSLRNFARLDEAEFKEADIHEGLDSTLTLLDHQIRDRIKLEKFYGNIPQIHCNPGQINQVFMNILLNASQAIKDRGTIRIETSSNKHSVIIRISDDGEGIPEKDQRNIFDPGYTTKGVGVGTGLGLSISYNIIKSHKGDIKVRSEVGRGTEFVITLPIK